MAVYQDKDEKSKPIKTKDGRSWYFRVYKDGKQYQSKKYLLKKDAEDAESLFILENKSQYKHKFVTVTESFFNQLYKTKKESTVECYKKDYTNHIKPYFEKYYVESIDMKSINGWFEYLEKKDLSVSFMNKIYSTFKCILDYAIKNRYIRENILTIHGRFQQKNDKIISDEEKIRYITLDEFNKFISVINSSLWKTFFLFAYYTGCRKGEIIALNWNDINFEKNEISISKTLYTKIKGKVNLTSTKTNKNRKIKMNNLLKTTLLNYKKEVMQFADFKNEWFVFGNTDYLAPTTIDNNKHKYFELSGVREITMHEFRHSHVSLLINEYVKASKEKNMKIDTAKFFLIMSNRMGHSIQVMQDTYMHLFPTIQDEIVDLLNNL